MLKDINTLYIFKSLNKTLNFRKKWFNYKFLNYEIFRLKEISLTTQVEFLPDALAHPLIMLSQLLVMVLRMEWTTGLSRTVGEQVGEKVDTSS